jgi:large subunit ribosomal protein L21
MYAIIDIAGQQFKVEKDQEIFVHRLEGEEGANVEFNEVLLIDNNGNISLGTPFIEGAKISAKIISHLKGDKILVFKKKRRKGYKKTTGHRQYLSKIQIENITEKIAKPAKAEVKEIAPAKIEIKPKASLKKKAETTPKSVIRAKPVSKAEVKSKVAPKTKTEAKPKTVSKTKTTAKAETKTEAKPKTATKAKPLTPAKAEAKPKTAPKVKTKTKKKAETKPKKETKKE